MHIRKKLIVVGVLVSPLLIAGCSSSSSDSPSSTASSISTIGGFGGNDGGSGGAGGYVDLYKEAGTGNIEMLASGTANASFGVMTPSTYLGSNPLNITTDTTIAVLAAEPAAGIPYLIDSNTALRVSDGNGTLSDEDPVTGISISSGVTLTLELNYTSYARVSLDNDVSNDGTITTADVSATDRGDLRIYPASYVGRAGSSIDTAGTLDGQNGGYVRISANYSLYNHGVISTSGADSAASDGGDGGDVGFYGDYVVQNTGDLNSLGGDAVSGIAGNGGYIDLEAYYGNLHNSGNLVSRGGNGQTGGNGDWVYLYAYTGDMLNRGDINAQGGAGSAGNGGDGDSIGMEAYGGKLVNSGSLLATGGDTSDAGFNGGDGGYAYFYTEYGSIYEYTPAEDLLVSGNIDLSGGDAVAAGSGNGGEGGYIDAEIYSYGYPSEARLAFLGYSEIDTSGGDANFGGSAGDIDMYNDEVWSDIDIDVPSGDVSNEANLIARGGNVVATATTTPANGGSGGDVELETGYNYGYLNPDLQMTSNSGDIDASGGESLESTTNSSGRSGYIWFWGYNGVSNSGNIIASGGDDLGTDGGITGYGNYANDVDMYAELGPVSNSGNIANNGGAGEYRGGRSDGVELYGPTVSNSGAISSNGGDADVALASSIGGSGGWVEFFSPDGPAGVTHSGSVSHTAGTGETANDWGAFVRGGLCVSGNGC